MSIVCRFYLTTVKKFLHKCQPGVGTWTRMGKIWSTQFVNTPLNTAQRASYLSNIQFFPSHFLAPRWYEKAHLPLGLVSRIFTYSRRNFTSFRYYSYITEAHFQAFGPSAQYAEATKKRYDSKLFQFKKFFSPFFKGFLGFLLILTLFSKFEIFKTFLNNKISNLCL